MLLDELEIAEPNNATQPLQRINYVGLFINCNLKDAEKNLILTNLWVPEVTYKFPLVEKNKTRNLRFQHRWLQLYKWLAYSEIKQGGFCKVCVDFSKIGGIGGQKLRVLVLKPMDSFKKTLETLKNYTNREYHKLALLKADRFLNICVQKEPEIINTLNEESALADETTDVSVKEQLTLCVRYLVGTGKDRNVHESFLKFTEVTSLTEKI
ncbi:hypothetical protein QTP88_023427 [Uroleucon formosanum]